MPVSLYRAMARSCRSPPQGITATVPPLHQHTNTHTFPSVSQYNSRDGEQEIEVGKEIGEKMGRVRVARRKNVSKLSRVEVRERRRKERKDRKRGRERLDDGHWRMNISQER